MSDERLGPVCRAARCYQLVRPIAAEYFVAWKMVGSLTERAGL
jgi:hypothetical protein